MRKKQLGFTLYELLIVLVIASILALFGNAIYGSAEVDCKNPNQRPGYIARAYEAAEIARLGALNIKLHTFATNSNRWPETIDELVGHYGVSEEDILDRWGNKFIYTPIWNVHSMGPVRKYKSHHPVNTYFDLYSPGPDGKTATPMTSTPGCDDIVVAIDGQYIGYAYRLYAQNNSGK